MSSSNDTRRFYLIRHGETDWNREFRYQGSSDIPLNRQGLEQARMLGVRMSGITPARVLTSPLKRASETARVIMEYNESGAGSELVSELREISFGIWEGLTVPEIKEIDGSTFECWKKAPFSCSPQGGETLDEILERSRRVADSLRESPPGNVFVVAHGGVLRAVIAAMMGFSEVDLLWRMRFDNCSVSVIDLWGNYPSLLLTNDTHHLRLGLERLESLSFPA